MALVNLGGSFLVPVGANIGMASTPSSTNAVTLDAVNEAMIFIGQITTSDGGSHTIDTTGSSSLGWRVDAATFSSGSTIVRVGLAAVSTTTGPPGRAVNVGDVITFDVSRSLTGGGGGITANAWQTHVPDTGSKTIANGDFIAFAIQMTARGGSDVINATFGLPTAIHHRPLVTTFTGATYTANIGLPNTIITFSDGAIGFFAGSDIFSLGLTRTFDNTGATKEYGQLFQLPFPVTIYGVYGWVDPDADFDVVLYSNPLGTPVAERTASIDLNTVGPAISRKLVTQFASPYSTTTSQAIAVVYKPGASSISVFYKTLANVAHRITDVWGTSGYGVSRGTGAFANANSSLDHYYIGLLVGAFDAGGGGRAVQINNDSLVA